MELDADTGVMHLQVQERQGQTATARSQKRGMGGGVLPQDPQKETTPLTPWFQILAPRTVRKHTSVVLSHPVCGNYFTIIVLNSIIMKK